VYKILVILLLLFYWTIINDIHDDYIVLFYEWRTVDWLKWKKNEESDRWRRQPNNDYSNDDIFIEIIWRMCNGGVND